MRFETGHLPEFGGEVNWATCRNAACANFRLAFEGEALSEKTGLSRNVSSRSLRQ